MYVRFNCFTVSSISRLLTYPSWRSEGIPSINTETVEPTKHQAGGHCIQLDRGMRKQHLFWMLTNGRTHSTIVDGDALPCVVTGHYLQRAKKNFRSTLTLRVNVRPRPSLLADVTGVLLLLSKLFAKSRLELGRVSESQLLTENINIEGAIKLNFVA